MGSWRIPFLTPSPEAVSSPPYTAPSIYMFYRSHGYGGRRHGHEVLLAVEIEVSPYIFLLWSVRMLILRLILQRCVVGIGRVGTN